MNPVLALLLQRSSSDEPALIDGTSGATLTWRDVAEVVEKWQHCTSTGPVGIALSEPLAMASNVLAGLASGTVIAPLDPAAPARDTAVRVKELGLTTLITDGSGASWERTVKLGSAAQIPQYPAAPALIMTSSGSTGQPKIVPLTVDQLMTTAEGVSGHLGLGPGERGYSPLPLFHINCIVIGVLSALVADSSLVLDRRFSRRAFWDTVKENDVTWLNLVPAILAILAGAGGAVAPTGRQPRLARSASAPLPRSVLDRFESRYGIPVVETYGMTEVASQITANPLGAVRPGSVGRPIGVELRVVDADGRGVEPGVVGRVQIRGRNVTDSYWMAGSSGDLQRRPALGPDGWLTTGDVGRLDSAGYLYLVGREGEIINRGGEKIRPREVEEVLLSDDRVAAAVVVGRHHPTVGEEPVAYVQPREPLSAAGRHTLADDLTRRCAEELARHKRPAAIEVKQKLPAGPTGKVRRAEVRRVANEGDRPAERNSENNPTIKETPVDSIFLELPEREAKPREQGMTMAIDNGIAQGVFADSLRSVAPYIDVVKFGWGTALVTPDIERKFEVLHDLGIGYYFGGTLFEKFAMQGRFESFLTLCRLCDCQYVEVSNGTVDISTVEKAAFISRCRDEGFTVLSEVGFKDAGRSDELSPHEWVTQIRSDLAAGATKVITEARESGKSGICHRDGTPRDDTVDAILGSGIPVSNLIFEAPNKELQTHFISRIGPNVNLGNIAPSDVIGLETLRLGLRSDTLLHFEAATHVA